jgi:hypothetical protein
MPDPRMFCSVAIAASRRVTSDGTLSSTGNGMGRLVLFTAKPASMFVIINCPPRHVSPGRFRAGVRTPIKSACEGGQSQGTWKGEPVSSGMAPSQFPLPVYLNSVGAGVEERFHEPFGLIPADHPRTGVSAAIIASEGTLLAVGGDVDDVGEDVATDVGGEVVVINEALVLSVLDVAGTWLVVTVDDAEAADVEVSAIEVGEALVSAVPVVMTVGTTLVVTEDGAPVSEDPPGGGGGGVGGNSASSTACCSTKVVEVTGQPTPTPRRF